MDISYRYQFNLSLQSNKIVYQRYDESKTGAHSEYWIYSWYHR